MTKSNMLTMEAVEAGIAAWLQSAQDTDRLLHEAAMNVITHAYEHGDATVCQKLIDAIGQTRGEKNALGKYSAKLVKRAKALQGAYMQWLRAYTPCVYTKKDGNFGWRLNKKRGWALEEARTNPFISFETEKEQKQRIVSVPQVATRLANTLETLEKAMEEGRFGGEWTEVEQAWVRRVVEIGKEFSEKTRPDTINIQACLEAGAELPTEDTE